MDGFWDLAQPPPSTVPIQLWGGGIQLLSHTLDGAEHDVAVFNPGGGCCGEGG